MFRLANAPTFVLSAACLLAALSAKGECGVVRGHLLNHPAPPTCGSLIFCAEGELLGRLNGNFTQKGIALTAAAGALPDPEVAPSVLFGSADIQLNTKLCNGVLFLKDTFVLNAMPPDPANPGDAFFSAVHTVDPLKSTGGCAGVTGQLRLIGVSAPEGVQADYEGVICTAN